MTKKIQLDDVEYSLDEISVSAQAKLDSLRFASERLKELDNMRALLQRAKKSYIEGLKKEILSQKSGLLLDDD